MFTIGRLMAPAMLHARGIHEFDAWASSFGDTRTELELQPSGRYKPVTRFAEFVNVPELIAMFRSFADVVQKDDLRQYLKLPSIMGGKRQIVTAPATAAFRAYQQKLDARIKAIEARTGPPQKGDDILLAVITDGRHAAIDMRLVGCEQGNDPDSKLNALIANAHRIWFETAEAAYVQVDGKPYPLRGAAQMIFSDLGTPAAEETRGFSAYRWIRQELIRLGVPAQQIAFMQDFKKSAAKQRLFNDVNSGRIRFLIGSTQTMGTGVNAQTRLIAEHHLDVPWLPSDIEQREGRIERQGNQNEEIQIYAYATLCSVDATSWGLLERKARFIAAALAGDTSIRRLEDVGATANQFAMAKALASGDPRLMQKAGLDAEIARLRRLRAAHDDDQYAVRREVANAESAIRHSEQRIRELEADIAIRRPTRGEAFTMTVNGRQTAERKTAGAGLLSRIRLLQKTQERGRWTLGELGGFPIKAQGRGVAGSFCDIEVWIERTGYEQDVKLGTDLTPLGLISRLEYCLERFEVELAEFDRRRKDAEARLPAYRKRLDEPFTLADELAAREAGVAELEASLAANDQGARDADMPAAA